MYERKADFQYALGVDPENIATLRRMMIPIPDQVIYSPASIYYVRSDQTRVGDGHANIAWIWDVISRDKLAVLLEPMGGADYLYTYVKSDKRDGEHALPEEGYSIFYAIMYRPILSGKEGTPIARSPKAYQSVKIQFVILSEETGYL